MYMYNVQCIVNLAKITNVQSTVAKKDGKKVGVSQIRVQLFKILQFDWSIAGHFFVVPSSGQGAILIVPTRYGGTAQLHVTC